MIATDTPPAPVARPYKGLAFADPTHPEDLAALNVSWWYDWTPTGQVPMLWGGSISTAIQPDYAGDLLVLNEPNLTTQASLTPQAAAARVATVRAWYPNARLIAAGASVFATSWVEQFVKAGGHADAWHVHAYTELWITPPVAQTYVEIHHNITGGEYWITEYGSPDGSLADFANMSEWFMRQPWITRIAAYTNRQPDGVPWGIGAGCDMVRADGSLTPIGEYYSQLPATR